MQHRLERFRERLLTGVGQAPRIRFGFPRWHRGFCAALALFMGGLAVLGWMEQSWSATLGLAGFSLIGAIGWWAFRLPWVYLDDRTVWGRGLHGWHGIAYRKVESIRETGWGHILVVESKTSELWISRDVEHYPQLYERLWAGVQAAFTLSEEDMHADASDAPGMNDPAFPLSQEEASEVIVRVRTNLKAVRRDGALACWRWTKVIPPLWMLIRDWSNPLRRQYRDHRVLFLEGQVVWGYIVSGPEELWERTGHDLPVQALFSTDLRFDSEPDGLRRIWANLCRQQEELGEGNMDLRRFFESIFDGFTTPRNMLVPTPCTEGRRVYYTTLMITRCDLPLGRLRSLWIPLIVRPGRCRSAMVLPWRLWTHALRRKWKTIPRDPEPVFDPPPMP